MNQRLRLGVALLIVLLIVRMVMLVAPSLVPDEPRASPVDSAATIARLLADTVADKRTLDSLVRLTRTATAREGRVDTLATASESLIASLTRDADSLGVSVVAVTPVGTLRNSAEVSVALQGHGLVADVANFLAAIEGSAPRRRIRQLRLATAGPAAEGRVDVTATVDALLSRKAGRP